MSFDDLLGSDDPPRRVKPTFIKPPAKPVDALAEHQLHLKMQQVHNLTAGVSTTWLASVFRLPAYKVKLALEKCPVLRTAQNGGKIYDIAMAARYLIEPTTDLDAFLQTIKPDKLPEKLRETYWNAKIKEMKARAMAGELWPTEAVLDVFAETFKTIKKTTQLWADTIDGSSNLSPEQHSLLMHLVDGLLDELHKSLVDHASNNATESFLKEIDDAAQ